MKHLLLLTGLLWTITATAEETLIKVPVPVPVLLPEPLVTRWLAQDPAVLGAQSALAAAKAEAGQMAASPYEWTTRYSRQQRDYGVNPKSNEWNLGIERTLRLPGKVGADRAGADALLKGAEAHFSLARRQAAEGLLGSWLDWLETRSAKDLLVQQQRLAEESLGVVAKRVQSGDAASLEQRLASADVADIKRSASAAATAETTAWVKLSARYPVNDVAPPPLPDPLPVPHNADWWQARILAVSDRLVVIQAEQAQADAGLKRAEADRIPDPTVGVFTGREAYGDEKIVGVSISMPFPGARRRFQVQQQLAAAEAARQNLAVTQRELTGQARADFANAHGNYTRWQLAKSAADAMAENARLAQKAYGLGEQDLQTLLLARRQALSAAEAEQKARVDALRAYDTLLLDAKLLWNGNPQDVENP